MLLPWIVVDSYLNLRDTVYSYSRTLPVPLLSVVSLFETGFSTVHHDYIFCVESWWIIIRTVTMGLKGKKNFVYKRIWDGYKITERKLSSLQILFGSLLIVLHSVMQMLLTDLWYIGQMSHISDYVIQRQILKTQFKAVLRHYNSKNSLQFLFSETKWWIYTENPNAI